MKYYKVIKENFLWEVGAILHENVNKVGYVPIDDIYRIHENFTEYISQPVVENSPDYFQKVYKVDLVTQVVYKLKDEAKALLEKHFKKIL